jgi:hypothetical protein
VLLNIFLTAEYHSVLFETIKGGMSNSMGMILPKFKLDVKWRNPRGWNLMMAAYLFGWNSNLNFLKEAGAEEPGPEGMIHINDWVRYFRIWNGVVSVLS